LKHGLESCLKEIAKLLFNSLFETFLNTRNLQKYDRIRFLIWKKSLKFATLCGYVKELMLVAMNQLVGIRHEDKYEMEKRVPVIPGHVRKLSEDGIKFLVQHSPKRIIGHEAYEEAGATIVKTLEDAPVIIGVKEIPSSAFETNKTYMFFSHVIKGQKHNMPMLKAMMEKRCQLIDYEKIENQENKRLVFFGRYAGLAGMINSLWSFGQRLLSMGIENPFSELKQCHNYQSLDDAMKAVSKVGNQIATKGMPDALLPVVIGFTGYGNVSKGAQEIAQLLPSIEISPKQLMTPGGLQALSNVIYKVVFKEEDIAIHNDGIEPFELQHYYNNPDQYRNNFEQYIPALSILMNCMYWDAKYPRIVTKDFLKSLYAKGEPKLKVIGDVTCDPDGSIECTHKGTEIEDPVFVYNPATGKPTSGFEGKGILVMAVDILPSELPYDASVGFSEALFPYLKSIITADYSLPYDKLELPEPIRKALILHQGELTPPYRYISQYL
jgi:saccharopine dehydrogenase (NAD+, L-lysine forming)